MAEFQINWIDGEEEPQCAPNLAYPRGIDLDMARPKDIACKISLPYPAKRCGVYAILCMSCGMSATVTTAGRPDDPRSVRLPCKLSRA